jgi:hypothetical protein
MSVVGAVGSIAGIGAPGASELIAMYEGSAGASAVWGVGSSAALLGFAGWVTGAALVVDAGVAGLIEIVAASADDGAATGLTVSVDVTTTIGWSTCWTWTGFAELEPPPSSSPSATPAPTRTAAAADVILV